MIETYGKRIIVTDMDDTKEKKLASGIVIAQERFDENAIHPRWAKVYKLGEDIDFLKEGDWILVKHGRWSYGLDIRHPDKEGEKLRLWVVDHEAVMLTSKERPLQ